MKTFMNNITQKAHDVDAPGSIACRQAAFLKYVQAVPPCSYHLRAGQKQRRVLSNSCHSKVFEHA